jgi:hypothetical protein
MNNSASGQSEKKPVKISVSIARDFSRTPGPRKNTEGPHSGEDFLEKILRPRFKDADALGVPLEVSLDGVAGYATSFLEAAFGGLSREFGIERVRGRLIIISEDEPYLKDEIEKYITEAFDDDK